MGHILNYLNRANQEDSKNAFSCARKEIEKARVFAEEGVQVLSDLNRGWEDSIDLDLLDMAHCNRCILGQLYGHFQDGWEVIKNASSLARLPSFDSVDVNHHALTTAYLEILSGERLENEIDMREGPTYDNSSD